MRRAFPEHAMTVPLIYGEECTPVCIANEKDDHVILREADVPDNSPKVVEKKLREICVK